MGGHGLLISRGQPGFKKLSGDLLFAFCPDALYYPHFYCHVKQIFALDNVLFSAILRDMMEEGTTKYISTVEAGTRLGISAQQVRNLLKLYPVKVRAITNRIYLRESDLGLLKKRRKPGREKKVKAVK